MSTIQKRRLRRAEATTYLLEEHGLHYAPATLAKLAVVGGGPKFQHAGRIPLYPTIELDAWAAEILSPLKSSTSDKPRAPRRSTDGALRERRRYRAATPPAGT